MKSEKKENNKLVKSNPDKILNKKDFQIDRRNFLKLGAAATAIGAASMTSAKEQIVEKVVENKSKKQKRIILNESDVFEFDGTYKPFHQKDNVFMSTIMGRFPKLQKKMFGFHGPDDIDSDIPGMTRLDYALKEGAYAVVEAMAPGTPASISNTGTNAWKQRTIEDKHHPFDYQYLFDDQYKFENKTQATKAIKKAAKLYNADLVGITHRNTNWDYAGFVDPLRKKQFGWEEFPFEPKSVIVMAFEMDYEAYTTAPTYTSEGATGDAYGRIVKATHQLATFLRILGYKAVATCNDTGLNIPYAIQSGLGEGSWMGLLITQKYGPRVRIGKVYTEFDFVNYDKPIEFGVTSFCENCMKCANACPSQAISRDKERGFKPTHGNKNDWFNNRGVKKWYLDSEKCFTYWMEINAGCGACITSCPYNKPDFWHHRMIDKVSSIMPSPIHKFMKKMDDLFGYGDTMNGQSVKDFWDYKED